MTIFVYLSNIDIWTIFVNVPAMSEVKKSKILAAAREVFLRYGFKRVSMNDIAEAAGVSRPALYVLFKNKEEIFKGVFLDWVDETILDIERSMPALPEPEQKLECAFELWTVRPFGLANQSPEAKELIDCTFGFAQEVQQQGYVRFEAAIAPVLAALLAKPSRLPAMDPKVVAHLLASAVRGFKQTAGTQAELRLLIKQLLSLSLSGPR